MLSTGVFGTESPGHTVPGIQNWRYGAKYHVMTGTTAPRKAKGMQSVIFPEQWEGGGERGFIAQPAANHQHCLPPGLGIMADSQPLEQFFLCFFVRYFVSLRRTTWLFVRGRIVAQQRLVAESNRRLLQYVPQSNYVVTTESKSPLFTNC